MKKILANLSILFFGFLSMTPLAAYADVSVDTCDKSGQFNALCAFQATSIGRIVQNVITVIFIVAVLIALFFLIFGGIKWVTSGGDKSKVEAARSHIVAAVIGLIVVFASYFILNFILNLFGLKNLGSFTLPTLTS